MPDESASVTDTMIDLTARFRELEQDRAAVMKIPCVATLVAENILLEKTVASLEKIIGGLEEEQKKLKSELEAAVKRLQTGRHRK